LVSDLRDWLGHPQTIEFRTTLEKAKRDMESHIGGGGTVAESVEQTAMATAKFTGYVYCLDMVLETLRDEEKE
jgi:hypothetical protein